MAALIAMNNETQFKPSNRAPPGGRSSIIFGDEYSPLEKPTQTSTHSNHASRFSYRQKSSIIFGDEVPMPATPSRPSTPAVTTAPYSNDLNSGSSPSKPAKKMGGTPDRTSIRGCFNVNDNEATIEKKRVGIAPGGPTTIVLA